MVADIGSILFVDLLGMTMYPGAPFTANIIRDIIMFFFIPTVFLIMIIYVLTGRIFTLNKQLRLLLGTAIYLFIIAGGYFKTFALLTGPYFIFLIFILGIVYFIPTHFRTRQAHGYSKEALHNAGRAEVAEGRAEDDIRYLLMGSKSVNPVTIARAKSDLKDLNKRIEKLEKVQEKGGDGARGVPEILDRLYERRDSLTEILHGNKR